jgi:transposase-like protein
MKEIRKKSSGRKEAVAVVPSQVRVSVGEVALDVGADFRELILTGGLALAEALFREELQRVCGPRYGRKGEAFASRWGHQRGEVVLGGRKVQLDHPRARRQGKEVVLPAYAQLQNEDPLDERALEQMLIGVSTRRYRRSLEPVIPSLNEFATSKSAVSRRFVAKTTAQLEAALAAPLDGIEWAGLMIDGIEFHEQVVVVVLGIDITGKKHVLSFRQGSTENGTLCRELLSSIVARGVPPDRSILVAIDGGKGLRKAVNEVFGDFAVVQRCQVHKKRNVLDQLPDELRAQVRAAMNQAYAAPSYETALRLAQNQVRVLAKEHPGAADSLREGLHETLAVKKLGLTGALAKTLETTNPIENVNSGIRRVAGRVKRCRGGGMALRWVATGALEHATKFRRLKGHKDMHKLVDALRARDAAMKNANVRKTG